MQPDNELLRQYSQTGSEVAFAELVKRHVNLVYSAAFRQVGGDAHLAHDVTQSVFTDLARKAASLCRRESLTGWLYTSAHFAASKLVRAEHRRREREEQFMSDPAHLPSSELDWETLRPILDSAMHGLQETDREAVLLRYFENRPYAEVGAKLGLNENAARMRVERALEKLRGTLARRAITTTATLAAVISANAVQIAPPALAVTLTKTALTAAGAGTSFALFKFMTLTRLRVGTGAIVVAGAVATMVFQHQVQNRLSNENDLLRQQLAQLKTENANLSTEASATRDAQSSTSNQLAELLKLRAEVTQLRKVTNSVVAAPPSNSTNTPPSENKLSFQIHLKVKFVSVPDDVLQKSSAGWGLSGNQASVLSQEQLQSFNGLMAQDDSIRTISAPQVVTLNGREAQLSVGSVVPFAGTNSAVPFGVTNVDIGSFVKVRPYYYSASAFFSLNVAVRFNQLIGDPSQPILESLQSTNQANLFVDQTMVLATKITSPGITDEAADLPNRPGNLLVFITPTLIDQAGNRLDPASLAHH